MLHDRAGGPDSCERVKNDIQQKIINNGVPETAFSLAIVPNDQRTSPALRWWVIAPTTPSKSPTPVTATVPPKTTLSKPASLSNERSYPCIDQDKICRLPITYYRSPRRLLKTRRSFSAQHNYHGVSNVESGIFRRRHPTRATKIHSPRFSGAGRRRASLPFTLRSAAAAVQQAAGDNTRIVWGACSVNCGSRCALRLHVRDDEVVYVETDNTGDDRYGDHQVRACLRGRSIRRRINHPDRLNYPMKRVGKRGEGKFERISW